MSSSSFGVRRSNQCLVRTSLLKRSMDSLILLVGLGDLRQNLRARASNDLVPGGSEGELVKSNIALLIG